MQFTLVTVTTTTVTSFESSFLAVVSEVMEEGVEDTKVVNAKVAVAHQLDALITELK